MRIPNNHILPKNNYYLVIQANDGVEAKLLIDLMTQTRHNKEFFAHILHLSTKTIDRYIKESKKLNPSESEKILKISQLYEQGIELFGSVDAFNRWLEKPAFGLGEQIPTDLMLTVSGIDLIKNELTNIEYGNLA